MGTWLFPSQAHGSCCHARVCTSLGVGVSPISCGHTPSSGDAGSWSRSLGVSHCCTSSTPLRGHCPLGWWELVPRETPAEAQLSQSMPQPHGRAWPLAWHGGSAPGCLSDLRVAWAGGKGLDRTVVRDPPWCLAPGSPVMMRVWGARCWCRCWPGTCTVALRGPPLPLSLFGNVGLRKKIPATCNPLARDNRGVHPRLA